MRKRVFVKRLLTVVLAATMVLSNSAAAFAEAPSAPAGDTVIVSDGGEEDNTKAAAEEENKTAPGEEEKTGDETNVTTPAFLDQTASDSLDTDVLSKDETVNTGDEEFVICTVPEITSTVDASKLPDNDDLLTGFLEKELKEQIDENKTEAAGPILRSSKRSALMGAIPRSQGMNLTGNDLVVYNFLKSEIEKVANGQSASTAFVLPLNLLNGGKLSYTADELDYGTTTTEGISVFLNKFKFDLDKIEDALLADCPYSLYWFDKTYYINTSSYSYYNGSNIIGIHDDTTVNIYLRVSKDYSVGGVTGSTAVDTTLTTAVSTAVTNANSVVDAAKSCSTDYQKLIYYRDWIADNVDYDYDISPSRYYGNPWQVVWVFDDNADTKVVCEGYSKAFKWLCDLTIFDDSKVGCHVVAGCLYQKGTELGGHMWNIVRMDDDKYYMADITNYDGDGGLNEPILFLNGYTSYANNLYRFDLSYFEYRGDYLSYKYYPETLSQFSAAELAISQTPYMDHYKVTFDANGHGVAPQPIENIERGMKISAPAEPTATGYSFGGWFKNRECTESWDFDTMPVTKDVTLYAKWSAVEHTVTFNANGGTGNMAPQNVLDSTATALSANLFTRDGYAFAGWNTSAAGNGANYSDTEAVNLITDLELYAMWEKIEADTPLITTQPLSTLALTYGKEAGKLSIVAKAQKENDYTLSYQWFKNDSKSVTGASALTGATSAELTIATDTVETAYYYCVVTATRKDNNETATATSMFSTVTVDKATPGITTAPTSKNDLVYSGTELELINTGVSNGGTVVYSLERNGSYSASSPKGKDAGTYTVFYKIQGDSNYKDTDVLESIDVMIAKRPVTVSGITACDKVYDGTTAATPDYSHANFDGVVSGIKLPVSATVAFKDKNAHDDKDVSVTNIRFATDEAGKNYILTDTVQATPGKASITPKPIKVTGITVDDKVYDGTTDANWHDVVFEGVCEGEEITVEPGTHHFENKNVCANQIVELGYWVIYASNTLASNYEIEDGSLPETTASITRRPVRINSGRIAAEEKEYDGTKNATISINSEEEALIIGKNDDRNAVIDGDTVNVVVGTGVFDKADAGTNIPVTLSGFALSGADKDNYELIEQPTGVTGTINRKTIGPVLSISVNGTYTYNGSAQIPSVTVKDGETLLTENDYEVVPKDGYDLKNAGYQYFTVKAKTGSNYAFVDQTSSFVIDKATLVITADNKTRKTGNANPAGTATVSGLKGNDSIDVSKLKYSFGADSNSTTGTYDITVSYDGTLYNYNITYANGTLTVVEKEARPLTVAQENIVYGTSIEEPSFFYESTTVSGTTEIIYRGTMRNGSVYGPTTVAPDKAGEYVVEVKCENNDAIYFGSKDFTIAPYDISSSSANTRVMLGDGHIYNGDEKTQRVSKVVSGELTLDPSEYTVTGNKATNAGDYTLTVTAKETGNFTGSVTKGYSIAKQIIKVEGIKVVSKEYDGTELAVLDGDANYLRVYPLLDNELEHTAWDAPINGGIAGCGVTATGTFEDKNAGTGKTVNITNIRLVGDAANNFELDVENSQKTATGTITKKSLTPTASVTGTYTYNGSVIVPENTEVTVTAGSETLNTSDYTVSCTDINAGTATATVSPAENGNYDFTPITANFTIGKAPITVADGITAEDKTYNGSDGATLVTTGATLSGLAACDAGKITVSATGKFADVNVGTGKKVIISGITLGATSGNEAVLNNYRLADTGNQAETTADITPKSITPSVSISGVYTYTGSAITPTVSVWDSASNRVLSADDYSIAVTDNTNAGSASVVVTQKEGGNYAFSEVNETFTINRAPVTVKADDKAKRVGNTEPALSWTVTGLLGSDDKSKISCTASRDSGEAAGTYTIYVSGETNQDNYYVTYVNGTLTISEKSTGTLNVTQNDATYLGTALSAPSYTVPAGTKKTEIKYTGTLRKDGSSYSAATAPAEAGDYKVEIMCETEDAIFTGSDTFKILPADLAAASLTLEKTSFVYTGEEITPVITSFTLGGSAVPGEAYTALGAGTKAASATDYTFTVTAKQNSNYTGSITKSYKIDPLKVTIEGLSVYDKEYDGNASASIKGTETLKTAANGSPYASDSVSVKRGTASFENKNAGTDKKVTFNGFELEGADAGNYYLESQPEAVKATISKKALKVSGIIAKDKTYDTKADVELEISSATLSGVISGETITIKSAHGAFSDENAGTDKTVNIDSIVLEGLTVGNYEFASDSQKTATATIDKASHDLIRMPGIEINTAGLTGEKAIDINLYLVPDVTLIKADIDSNINSYIIPVSNSSNIYKYKCDDSFASSQDGVSGYITYTVTSKNYADYNILLYVTLKNKSADVVLDTSSAAGSNVTEALGASESLKDLAASQDEEKVNTAVKLKVKSDDEVKNDDAVGAADLTKCINEECSGIAENNLKTDNVDISIFKTYKDSESNLQTTQITDTSKVIGISFKYNLFGRFNPKMFTLHGSVAKQLKRLMTKPDENELQSCEGCFFVEDNGKDSIFTIYSSEYSVFTVVSSTVPVYEVKLDDTLGKVTSIEISQNNKITKPADPVKDGYTFDGWFDANGKAWNFNNLVTSTVVLTARFTKKATSTVVVQPTDSSETTQQSSESASETTKQEEAPAQSTVTQAKAATSNASNTSKNKGTVTDTKTETKIETKEESVAEPVVAATTETVETVEEIKEEVTDTKEVTKESEPAKEPEIAEPEKEKKFPGGLLAGVLGGIALLAAAAYIFIKKRL